MFNHKINLVLIATVLIVGHWTKVESRVLRESDDSQTTTLTKYDKEQIGWVVPLRDMWYTFIDEPEEHFQRAKEALKNKEITTAASEIRKARAILRLETFRVIDDADYNLLWTAVDKLSGLAKNVADNKVHSEEELHDSFALVHYALAKHHYRKAEKFWHEQKYSFTGKDLAAMDINLLHSMEWVGYVPDIRQEATIQETRKLSAELIEDKGFQAVKVWQTLEELDGIIDEVGQMRPFTEE